MRNLFHVARRHMASDAVIGRPPRSNAEPAAGFAMAPETLRAEIGRRSHCIRLLMRIVTGEAAQFPVRCLVAFTELHRAVMLEQIGVPPGVRQSDDRNRTHQRCRWPKTTVLLSGQH